ncbi:MAG: ankyrin repeat domain-containing protein [Acidobacteriota bacterium]
MKQTLAALLFPVLLVAQPAAEPPGVFSAIRQNRLDELKTWWKTNEPGSVADKLGNQPLHYAALYGSPEAVKALLDAGASPNGRNTAEVTPLIYAGWNAAKVRMMLEKGGDAKAASKMGRTALHVAVVSVDGADAARMLLDKGADVNAADAQGDTPLTVASMNDSALVRLLIERGADPKMVNKVGGTALMNAGGASNVEAIKLLLAKGANVNAALTHGGRVPRGEIALNHLTPLMLATPYGTPAAVKALLDAGADVKLRDIRGMTALMLATASDHQSMEVMKMLIAAGSDVNAKDNGGESVMDWARKNTNPQMAKMLEAAGAKTAMSPSVAPKAGQPVALRAAVMRSVQLMEKSNPTFFKEGGCVSCHHQVPSAMAVRAAREAGLDYDKAAEAEQAKISTALTIPFGGAMMQGVEIGGGTDTATSTAMGAMAHGIEPGMASDMLSHFIAVRQNANGSWTLAGIARPPMEESDIARTTYAVKVLQHYSWPARKAEFAARIAKARAYLETAKPTTTYETAELLLGLKWTGSPKAAVIARQLASMQDSSGGWSQKTNMMADAYATGLSLYALRESGMAVTDRPYEKGVSFLVKTQLDDGSWYVASRAAKFQPYFQSGFPHDHDQWLSMIATAYAVRAMAPAIPAIKLTASK